MDVRLVYLTALLVLGWLAQWLAWRLRLPAILLLLLLGFAVGQFVDAEELLGRELLFAAVSLSVGVILFEGGLSLRLRELRETGGAVLRLVTVGILITWMLATIAGLSILGLARPIAILLGAILVVSGPTVIMPLLQHVRPNRRLAGVIKWEGIVNDPIGAVLAVLIFEAVRNGGIQYAANETAVKLALTAAVGVVMGLAAALLLIETLRRYWIPDHLQSFAFLAAGLGVFTASNIARSESGLIAVTLFGVVLANQKAAPIKHVQEFKENLRVLLISMLFILLGSRMALDDLVELGPRGLLFVAVIIVVIRPTAVFLATIGSELRMRERLYLACLGPKGIVAAAVSSVFALELAADANLAPHVVESARQLAPITFLVIVGTVAIHGLTAGPLAYWLKLAEPKPQGILFAGASAPVRAIASVLAKEGIPVLLVDSNQREIAAARMAGLPTFWASILSDYSRNELELSGIGRLLAMTPNDEVNAMACQEFVEFFGRAGVYQVAPKPSDRDSHEPVSPHRRGRLLAHRELTYSRLQEHFVRGAAVKITQLTAEFTYQAFRSRHGENAVVLFTLDDTGKLTVATTDQSLAPRPGQRLISLILPAEAEG